MGATPVEMRPEMVADAVAAGSADAALLSWERVGERLVGSHVEVGPGNPGITTCLFVLAMSRDSYRALADDLKAVIDANSGTETAAWLGRVLDEAAAEARKAALARGDAVRAMSANERERWAQAARRVTDARVTALEQADIRLKPLLDSAREQLQEFDSSR
jgi:TRAP-type C4-dicarboxylate transport system substrate-binding protein